MPDPEPPTDQRSGSPGDQAFRARAEQVQHIAEEYLRSQMLGMGITEDAFLELHPDLLPELRTAIENAKLVQRAFDQSNRPSLDRSSSKGNETAALSGIRVRCPHCHESNVALPDSIWTSLTCPHCTMEFSLVPDAPSTSDPSHVFPQHLQPIEPLGTGSFGQVWKAFDKERQRAVAVKLPHVHSMPSEMVERFLREARALAQLQHPNIIRVLEVGRSADVLYIVSELIDGPSLAEWLVAHQMTARESAQLCLTLARALDHSHQHGIVHRDMKPANVLLDASHTPHITDFGLAQQQLVATVTLSGEIVGTPAYMSPEQAQGDSHVVDPRTDIYSLGMILFELLAGQVPFQGTFPQVVQQVLRDDPSTPRKWNNTVPRELATITLKCLEKKPSRRYSTGLELAQDLERYLAGQPILARPTSSARRMARWCRRHRAVASLTLLLVAVLLAVATFTTALSSRSSAVARNQRWERYLSDMHRAMQAWEEAQPALVEQLLEEHRLPAQSKERPGFEWRYLANSLETSRAATTTLQDSFPLRSVNFFRDGRRLAVCGFSLDVSIWDIESRRKLKAFRIPDADMIKEVAISPDERHLALGCNDGAVRIVDIESGELIERLSIDERPERWVQALEYSRDGKWLIASACIGPLALFDRSSGGPAVILFDYKISANALAISPDSQWVTCVMGDEVGVWNIATQKQQLHFQGHSGQEVAGRTNIVESVAFSADGQLIASGDSAGVIRVWRAIDGNEVATLRGHSQIIFGLTFHTDGVLVSSSGDQTIRYWNVETGRELSVVRIHNSDANDIAISPNGTLLASVEYNGGIGLAQWNATGPVVAIQTGRDDCWDLAFSSDSRWLAAGYRNRGILVFDAKTGQVVAKNTTYFPISHLTFTPNNELVFDAHPGRIGRWNWEKDGGRDLPSIVSTRDGPIDADSFDFSHDYKTMISKSGAKESRIWEWPSLVERTVMVGDDRWGTVKMSGDGRYAVTTVDNSLRVFDAHTGRHLRDIAVHQGEISTVEASKHDNLVATGGFDGAIGLIEIPSGQIRHVLHGHRGYVEGLSFLADGNTLASASLDGTMRLWDLKTGRELTVFQTKLQQLRVVAASSDGRTIAASGWGDLIHLWRAQD